MNLKQAAQLALEYIEQNAIISGIPIRDALRAALAEDAMQRLTDVQHEIENSHQVTGDHLRDATKMVATSQESRQVEPVAWMYTSQWRGNERFITRYQSELTTYKADKVWPLYAAPPNRKPMTDEEIHDCFQQKHKDKATERRMIARAIERAHGIGGEK